jgi:hypothetical protein
MVWLLIAFWLRAMGTDISFNCVTTRPLWEIMGINGEGGFVMSEAFSLRNARPQPDKKTTNDDERYDRYR